MAVSTSSGLTQEQIQHMVHDAETYALEDKLRKEIAKERDLAESVCLLAEKTITELSDRLTLKQQDMLVSLVTKVRSILMTDHIDNIRLLREELEQVFREASEDIYNQLFYEAQQNN